MENREIHYHVKVEIEKKALERQDDFNTVACFTAIDHDKNGYMNYLDVKEYMKKYNKEVNKPAINAVLRRLDSDNDGKITFKEFAQSITPEYPGLEVEQMEFNMSKKDELVKEMEEKKKTELKDRSPSPLRDYRNIYA